MSPRSDALPLRTSKSDVHLRVLNALMLRDMRSRFGGSYWGYLAQVMWPVVHMFIIAAAMTFRNVPSPVGGSTMLFVATGAVPALAFKYISREMMKGYTVHKSLTYFPQVKTFDTLIARALVEIVSSFMGLMVIFSVLMAFGIDPMPVDIATAIGGYLTAIVLGICVGTVNVGIVSFFPGWQIGYTLFAILIYLASGVMFLPVFMPQQLYDIMKWNPVLQLIEWVRQGYYPEVHVEVDYVYLFLWCGCSLTIGLLMERYIARGR